jgi:hypothetical protein
MEDIYLYRYDKDKKELWNNFVSKCKNESFMFNRDYMDYHSNIFQDNSLMFFQKNKLISVMPANIKDNVLVSHGGLTFGGILSDQDMTTSKMLKIFSLLLDYANQNNLQKIKYKAVPYIYHNVPAGEDLYALYRFNFKLTRRDISTCIYIGNRIEPSHMRKRVIKKSTKAGLNIRRCYDFGVFMAMLSKVLNDKYNVSPVHSTEEIKLLSSRFPDNIKLFGAYDKDQMIAGTIVYETSQVAHTQYLASSDEGKKVGALDAVIEYLVNEYYCSKKYFDFGISTEKNGIYLNEGLIHQKETFGGRAVVHDFYEYNNQEK